MIEDDLLAAIAADVDAPEPRLVYADWLVQQGDPRGELAIVEHHLASRLEDPMLRRRRAALWDAVRSRLFAPDLFRAVLRKTHLGFVDHLVATRRAIEFFEATPASLDQPALRFIRHLHLACTDAAGWRFVASWRQRTHVRHFEYRSLQRPITRDVVARIEQFPAIREVSLYTSRMPDVSKLPDRVRALRIDLRGALDASLETLYTRNLETLVLRSQRTETERLRPLLDGAVLTGVRHLELRCGFPVELVEALVASGRIATLETLALDFSSWGIDRLVAFGASLAHVRLVPSLVHDERDYAARHLPVELLLKLDRVEDALELFDSRGGIGPGVLYASAIARTGDRTRWRQAIDALSLWRSYRATHDLKTFFEAFPAGEPWMTEHRIRAAIAAGERDTARQQLERLPASDTTRLLGALVDRRSAPSVIDETRNATYVALGWLLQGTFPAMVPAAIEPADVLAAVHAQATVGLDPGLDDPIDVACIAAIAASHANDRRLCRARIEALAGISGDAVRPVHHDLVAVVRALGRPDLPDSLSMDILDAVRGPYGASRLAHCALELAEWEARFRS